MFSNSPTVSMASFAVRLLGSRPATQFEAKA